MGLRRGGVSREGIHETMDGCVHIREQIHQWSSKAMMQHAVGDVIYVMQHWFVRVQEEPSIAPPRARRSCRTKSETSAPAGFVPLEAVVVPQAEGGQAAMCPSPSDLYRCGGTTYRKKHSKASGVNASWALEDIQEYAQAQSTLAEPYDEGLEAPREPIDDFVETMRNCASAHHSVFQWPTGSLNFQKAMGFAIHHLPLGCMIILKSRREPRRFS
jgi:hypothetical protein